MRDRRPVLERLELLMANDVSAQRAGLIFMLVISLSPVDLSVPFYSHALSLEVIAPSATAVHLLYLVILDSQQRAHEQVAEAALRHGLHDLNISRYLGFSSKALEDAFHRWLMSKATARKMQPRLALAAQLSAHYLLAQKGDSGCGWAHQLVGAPATITLVTVLVLQSRVDPRLVSLFTLGGMISSLCSMVAMVLAGDNCITSMHCQSGSLLEIIVGTICFAMVGFLLFPVTMEHHSLSAAVTFVATVLIKVQQLVSTQGGVVLWSMERHWGILAIVLAALLTCQLSFVGRYYLGALNRRSFLNSLPPLAS